MKRSVKIALHASVLSKQIEFFWVVEVDEGDAGSALLIFDTFYDTHRVRLARFCSQVEVIGGRPVSTRYAVEKPIGAQSWSSRPGHARTECVSGREVATDDERAVFDVLDRAWIANRQYLARFATAPG